MTIPKDLYFLFPLVVGAIWSSCPSCNDPESRIGLGGRVVLCPDCDTSRTGLHGGVLPEWLRSLIRDHTIKDSGHNWVNAGHHVRGTLVGDIEFFVWLRSDGLHYGEVDDGLPELTHLFEYLMSGTYNIYDFLGRVIGTWSDGLVVSNHIYWTEKPWPAI